ncbi:unnamed protein product, partial [Ectocarpus sp. 12 AP-2014]
VGVGQQRTYRQQDLEKKTSKRTGTRNGTQQEGDLRSSSQRQRRNQTTINSKSLPLKFRKYEGRSDTDVITPIGPDTSENRAARRDADLIRMHGLQNGKGR